jgi:hypothetical protein
MHFLILRHDCLPYLLWTVFLQEPEGSLLKRHLGSGARNYYPSEGSVSISIDLCVFSAYWSVPSSEVTKCDTNTSPRRLATHLLQQVVQSLTSRRHSGHGSANATRDNTSAKDQTTIAKASKASSEYHTMEALCGGPEYTGTVGCRAATYLTSSGTKSGSVGYTPRVPIRGRMKTDSY